MCKLSFGQCLRGRRCRVLQNSSQAGSTNNNARRRDDYYAKRRDETKKTGFFHASLGFMSKLFDTVYNYIFE